MDAEDVTLVIPCYNVADTLPRALSAVDTLDPAPSSVVCVDDGSTDGTAALIELHDEVRLVEHEENRGLGVTLNTALAEVDTPLLAKIDADIVVSADWLGEILDAYTDNDAALVQGRFEEETTTVADRWRETNPSPSTYFKEFPEWNKPRNGATMLASTEALRDIGGWDVRHRRAFDDIDLMQRLIEAGYDIYYTPSARSIHIRTDTWKEVLRTAWAYHNDPSDGGEPESYSNVVSRLGSHVGEWKHSLISDIKDRRFDQMWISMARLPYHLKWDIEHVRRTKKS